MQLLLAPKSLLHQNYPNLCKTLQALLYKTTVGDEVEDLLALLMYAKQEMPELQAVSCGAIASDYQRLRVEHVRSAMYAKASGPCTQL